MNVCNGNISKKILEMNSNIGLIQGLKPCNHLKTVDIGLLEAVYSFSAGRVSTLSEF